MAQFRPKFGQKWSFLGYKNRQKGAILGLEIGSRFCQNSYRLTDLQNRQFADLSAELATLFTRVIKSYLICVSSHFLKCNLDKSIFECGSTLNWIYQISKQVL